MTLSYGAIDWVAHEAESLKTIATALDLGINMLDTAWIYQVHLSFPLHNTTHSLILLHRTHQAPNPAGGENYKNEELVGKAIKIHGREKFVIATKFGIKSLTSREVSMDFEVIVRV